MRHKLVVAPALSLKMTTNIYIYMVIIQYGEGLDIFPFNVSEQFLTSVLKWIVRRESW